MQIVFDSFDWGSYIVGVLTPFGIALVVAVIQTLFQKKK